MILKRIKNLFKKKFISVQSDKRDIILRESTSDVKIWQEVFHDNCYHLNASVKGRTVIDIGANIGAFSCLASKLGASKVVSFEAASLNYEVFSENAKQFNNIFPFNLAAGDTDDGTLNMYNEEEFLRQFDPETIEKIKDGSLPLNYGGYWSGNFINGSQRVKTITLSTAMEQNNIYYLDLLKIDCESCEWLIFANMSKDTFSKIGEMIGEYHLFGNVENISDKQEPLSFLEELLSGHNFDVQIVKDPNNDLLGYFYAKNKSVQIPCIDKFW